MFRLLALEERGVLTPEHVRLAAFSAGRSVRTVQRWLQTAREEGRTVRKPRPRFTVTGEVHARLALWCGNAAAVHRELLAQARVSADDSVDGAAGGEPASSARSGGGVGVPSLATFQRAVRRDLNAGQRAALKGGERARRAHDVYLARPPQWRNACWEGDHKHLPVEVELDGELVRPWVTWFIDCARNAITGAAVTPHQPSRDAVLAALRIALSRDEPGGPYGPIGGLPELVRVDRGKEFLCATVTRALGALAVPVQDLPARRPELKGTVENLNHCVTAMFLVAQPGYLHAPTATTRPPSRRSDPADVLSFTEFTARLLGWVRWWNTDHRPQPLGGRTPLEAWQDDPTPIEDVPPDLLRSFTLEDAGGDKVLSTKGVYWRGRYYVGPWMHGMDGTRVRVRFIPHHDHEIEVFDAVTGTHLGPAHLADAATAAQRAALRRAKDAQRRTMVRALASADRQRRQLGRYGAGTEPMRPEPLAALTAAEAEEQLATAAGSALAKRALPDLIPPREAPASWARPIRRPRPAAPGTDADPPAPDAAHTPGSGGGAVNGTDEEEAEEGGSP
ncbi:MULTISPECIES: Mu transposase C-terminal domain-containing protein [unclassified Kitasatospora]|uniref:Mu transposase C-terminal domain-containing protein n=1 Tax=unclassified Kitasatospora TaxID=2633591 RepID=UPI0038305D59